MLFAITKGLSVSV